MASALEATSRLRKIDDGPSRVRVLVVDTSEDDFDLLQGELSMRGVRSDCTRVASPEAFSAALDGGEWDVLISEHRLPAFDVFKAMDIVKGKGRDLPVIIYSNHIDWNFAVTAMYGGVADFVEKGKYDRLVPVIEREVRGLRARQAAREADARLDHLENFDHLSRLPNRNLFCTRVASWLEECDRRSKPRKGTLVTLDVDRFLRVNASFGYDAGNRILKEIAARLVGAVDADAMLTRINSDVFGAFFPGIATPEAATVMARWINAIFEAPFLQERVEIFLTASIGVALADGGVGTAFDLLTQAETAMALAKKGGGNQYQFFDPAVSVTSAERMSLEADLRHAIGRQELELVYQPVVDGAGQLRGVEALLRWNHPRLGKVSPDRFIPLADETGLIVPIGEWVLTEACRQCRVWQDMGFPWMRIAVNVSAIQFGQPRLLQVVGDALGSHGLQGDRLTLEITESSLMKDPEVTAGMLRALKNLGVMISVDDFGTGYSSLSYLRKFPLDIIKIDKSFIRDICTDKESVAIVRAITALARSMRRETIAEGVESADQQSVLIRERCNGFQGYFFGRPVDAAALTQRLMAECTAKMSGHRDSIGCKAT
ncbi:MAG: EAL domain-containing protein [Zoogloeaceae bacterium]|nr:EAL domain-containing protein [Zoogloeaceae bacterium]